MSKIEDSVCSDIQNRADFGAKKYGVTMERTDLSETQWLQHAYEEALDLAVYLKKIMRERGKETIRIGGYNIPKPLSSLEGHHVVYRVDLCSVEEEEVAGFGYFHLYLPFGLIHSSRENGELHRKALLSLTTLEKNNANS